MMRKDVDIINLGLVWSVNYGGYLFINKVNGVLSRKEEVFVNDIY